MAGAFGTTAAAAKSGILAPESTAIGDALASPVLGILHAGGFKDAAVERTSPISRSEYEGIFGKGTYDDPVHRADLEMAMHGTPTKYGKVSLEDAKAFEASPYYDTWAVGTGGADPSGTTPSTTTKSTSTPSTPSVSLSLGTRAPTDIPLRYPYLIPSRFDFSGPANMPYTGDYWARAGLPMGLLEYQYPDPYALAGVGGLLSGGSRYPTGVASIFDSRGGSTVGGAKTAGTTSTSTTSDDKKDDKKDDEKDDDERVDGPPETGGGDGPMAGDHPGLPFWGSKYTGDPRSAEELTTLATAMEDEYEKLLDPTLGMYEADSEELGLFISDAGATPTLGTLTTEAEKMGIAAPGSTYAAAPSAPTVSRAFDPTPDTGPHSDDRTITEIISAAPAPTPAPPPVHISSPVYRAPEVSRPVPTSMAPTTAGYTTSWEGGRHGGSVTRDASGDVVSSFSMDFASDDFMSGGRSPDTAEGWEGMGFYE